MTTLLQNNDQTIKTKISKDNVVIDLSTINEALYRIYSVQTFDEISEQQSLSSKTILLTKQSKTEKTGVVIEKRLSNNTLTIDNTTNELIINISSSDCENLRGKYYHELTITDANNKKSTAFKDYITFEQTEN